MFIFNNLGNQIGATTTDASGNYTFSGLTSASRYRVEFRNLPANFEPTPNGPDNGSAVQFITVPDCDADFGVNHPGDYCEENPSVAVPCYVNGDISAPSVAAMDALVYFPYEAWAAYDNGLGKAVSHPAPSHVATAGQIGTTWGMAYRRESQTLFASAVIKRHCDLGPLGTGGIYKMDMTNPAAPVVSNWVDVQTLGINTGADPRDGTPGNTLPGSTTQPSFDNKAFDAVGKRAIGDLEFDEERNTLWFVNLNEQTLCGIENISPTAAPTASDVVGEFSITMPSGYACAGGASTHAWGLNVHDGLVYVAVLCTQELSNPDSVDLDGYVLSFNPDNPGAGFQYVASLPMNIVKYSYGLFYYQNWIDSYASNSGLPSPIISDIEFDDDGSLILGVSDRLGFQRGYQNYLPDATLSNTTLVDYAQTGDILRLCKIGNNYVLPGSDPGCPLLNSSLGDGGEFYWGDWGPWASVDNNSPSNGFTENAMGALARFPGTGQVLSSQSDPVAYRSAGVVTYNNSTGAADNRYQVYDEYMLGTQGKASGLGDLEILCALPPLEIGNFVWLDADEDGVQDASENPLSGIVVELWKNGSKIAQTNTNTSGEYYFSDKNAAGVTWTGTGADTALQMNTAYEIRISMSQIALAGHSMTLQNATANGGNDQTDNDASVSGGNAVIAMATGGIGFVDHSFDFGFVVCTPLTVSISGSDSVCVGGSKTLTSSISGGSATFFQWQFSPNGTTWSDIAGANSASYTTPALTTNSYYRLLASVTSLACAYTSNNVVFIAVVPNATVTIVGANIDICPGGSGTLTATITSGGAGTPTYQWQISSDGTIFTNISGATNSVYNTGTLTQTRHYQVVINFTGSNCGAATSAIGTLTVVPDPAVSVSGGGTVCSGASVTLTANSSGGTGTCTFLWQRKVGAAWLDISGATGQTYTTPVLTATTFYRARRSCTGSGCDPATSDSVGLVVVSGTAISDQPDGSVICLNSSTTLTTAVTGGAGTISYQWQYFNGTTWNSVSNGLPTGATFTGANSNSLIVNGISNAGSYDFRVLVNASGTGCTQVVSQVATVDAVPPPSATLISTACSQTLQTYSAQLSLGSAVVTDVTAGLVQGDEIIMIPAGQNIAVTVDEFGCPQLLNLSAPNCSCPNIGTAMNPGNTNICLGSAIPTLSVTLDPGLTADWYNSPSGGVLLGSGSSFFPGSSLAAGTYTYYVLARDPLTNCVAAARTAVSLTISQKPTLVAGADVSVCPGSNASLSASASGGTGVINYAWSHGLGTGASKIVNPTVSTTYTVVVADAVGCTAADDQMVSMLPAPNFALTTTATCPTTPRGATIVPYGNIVPASTEISINGGAWQSYPSGGILPGLNLGLNTVSVRIVGGCSVTKTVTIGLSN